MQDTVCPTPDEQNQVYIHKSENIVAFNQFTGKQAGKAPSLLQLKVIYDGLNEVCKTGNLVVRFPISEFWKFSGVTNLVRTHTDILVDGVSDLFTRLTCKGYIDPHSGHRRIEFFPWVYKAVVEETDDGPVMELHFSPDLKDDILSDENAISFSLTSINQMSSKYGPRLYDMLLVAIGGFSSVMFEKSLDDVRAYVDATQVKRAVDLRKNVIEPAVREVNEHTNLHVEFEMKKTGRAFSHICFVVHKKTPPMLITESEAETPSEGEEQETPNVIQRICDQIAYEVMREDFERKGSMDALATLNLCVDIMEGVYSTTSEEIPSYKITQNGAVRNVPHEEVTQRFEQLDQFHVLHVIDNVMRYSKKIVHPQNFVLACLFNAPLTRDVQVQSQVNEDMEKAQEAAYTDSMAESVRQFMSWSDPAEDSAG